MRTTITLDDEAFAILREHAALHDISLGSAASELIRKGNRYRIPLKMVDGLPAFDLPPDSPAVTDDMVRRALEEE